ncbi:restriction endonuclease subunit S [Aliivibrio fischeri]|uniref:restriction endonuclease subunit S n=1 Tax=Aliivibrio fischeri TaxID=668 RepID=UPI0012DAEDF3|nr:restriction endonuclease subunit S [Aliivibrio fischeri]MUK42536.1 restriction endonuclease subunit S [Aliivibrio fischeri]
MGSEWKKASLTDHYEIRSGLSKPAKDFGSGYPFLTFKNVFYNYFVPSELTELVQSTEKDRTGCSVMRGDVFLTRTSETMNELGMSCVALKNYENATFNGFCKRLRPKTESELVPEYVGYYLRSQKFRKDMLAFSTMSTRASLNNDMIGRLEISYPSAAMQNKIAHILKTLDNKITLNRQINQTLEQMAQTLFKSWFVDFDPVIDNALDAISNGQNIEIPESLAKRFEARKAVRESEGFEPLPADIRQLFPCEFEESELGFVPKGWGYKPAQDIASISIGKTPPRKETEWFSDVKAKNVTWISIRDMGNCGVFTQESNEYLVPEAISKFNVKVIPKDSVILSFKMTLGRVSIASTELATNEAIAHFVNPKFGINKEYLYSYLMTFNYDSLGSTSSIATAVNSKLIKQLPVLVPDSSILDTYFERVTGIFEKLQSVDCEVSTLINLRDTLLPKLISGELRLDSLQGEALQQAVSAE